MRMPRSWFGAVGTIKLANLTCLAVVPVSMGQSTAYASNGNGGLCRRPRVGLTQSVTGKKNGEDREALAVRIKRSRSSYCWPPFGYWMNCPFWKQMSAVNSVVSVPATQPLFAPSLPGDWSV